MPHSPGQGSWHLRLMHALSEGQSELTTHSGRQFGGEPIISGRHEHWHLSPITRGGLLFGPHGLGSQGSTYTGSIAKISPINIYALRLAKETYALAVCDKR